MADDQKKTTQTPPLKSFAGLKTALDGQPSSVVLPVRVAPSDTTGVSTKPTVSPDTPKRLSVPAKTLTLKPRVETGTVRQTFSHGRTKQVVVEKRNRPEDRDFNSARSKLEQARKEGADTLDLSDLAELRKLPTFATNDGLKRLKINGTKVQDIQALQPLNLLEYLDISGTQIAELMPLARMVSLRQLLARGTRVIDLTPLADLRHLEVLDVGDLPISSFEVLARIPSLKTFVARNTAISSLSSIRTNLNLRLLDCANTSIDDLDPISGLSQLKELDVSKTRVSDLAPLKHLNRLESLNLTGTRVVDLAPITELSKLGDGARINPESQGIQFMGCPIADPELLSIAAKGNPLRTIETLSFLRREKAKVEYTGPVPSAESIPAQVKTAFEFSSAAKGPLQLRADESPPAIDPEQVDLYARMREQLSSLLQQIPSQERIQVTALVEEFLSEPIAWEDVAFKKRLWLCGNSLRNVLDQHDAVSRDPDPHYAKLPPATAEILRRPVETWNIVVLGDPTLRELDTLRLGPKERQTTKNELELAKPVVLAAVDDPQITAPETAATMKTSLAAADAGSDNIHTRQAQVLARNSSQNLVVQIIRGAYQVAQDLQNPQTEEARSFAKEYKAGAYKKLGEWTVTGAVGAVGLAATATATGIYYYSAPFFEFVVSHDALLRAYLAMTFDNPQLVQIVEWMTAVRGRFFDGVGTKKDIA